MQAITSQPDSLGRYRLSDFLCELHQSKDIEDTWEQAIGLFHGVRQILCAGYLLVRDDGTLYPVNTNVPENQERRVFLFVLKKYDSNVRM